jgi:hypothetical protein
MPVFQVKRRTVEEETFYVEVDETNELEKVIYQGTQDAAKLQQLLAQAKCENAVNQDVKHVAWSLDYAGDVAKPHIVGKLDIVNKFYVKVRFNVTHAFSLLFEVHAKKRNNVVDILSENLDNEFSDIVKDIGPTMFRDKFLVDSDYEVLEWGTNLDSIKDCPPAAVRVYKEED